MIARHLEEQVRNIKKKSVISEFDWKIIEANFDMPPVMQEDTYHITQEHLNSESQTDEIHIEIPSIREFASPQHETDIDHIGPA